MRRRSEEESRAPVDVESVPERRRPEAADAQGARAAPHFRELVEAECHALLERNNVGRIAYTFRDRVDIRPVHYVKHDGWLYGRTSAGEKLDVLHRSRWVAFEVDEIEGVFEWRSVVVHGAFYVLDPDGAEDEKEAWARGVTLLRTIIPGTATPDDPVPQRDVMFRIHIDAMTGRQATSRSAAEREVPLE